MTDTDTSPVLYRISANSLFPLCWSVIRNVCQWQTFDLDHDLDHLDLDHALCEGDCNYKQLNTLNLLAADELPNVIQTADGCMFSVEYLSLENGEVSAHSQEFAFLTGIHNGCVDKCVGFLVFISGFTIAVIPYLDSYYLFDSHSRNGQGSMIPQGKVISITKVCRFAGHRKVCSSGIFTRKKSKSCLLSNPVCPCKH